MNHDFGDLDKYREFADIAEALVAQEPLPRDEFLAACERIIVTEGTTEDWELYSYWWRHPQALELLGGHRERWNAARDAMSLERTKVWWSSSCAASDLRAFLDGIAGDTREMTTHFALGMVFSRLRIPTAAAEETLAWANLRRRLAKRPLVSPLDEHETEMIERGKRVITAMQNEGP